MCSWNVYLVVCAEYLRTLFNLRFSLGIRACLCYLAALFVLPQYFHARIGLANGIVFFGAPVGTLALTPFVAHLLQSVGLARTFQILAGIQLVIVCSGFMIRLVTPPSKSDQLHSESERKSGFDWTIFKNKGYMTFVVALCLFMPAYLVHVHLVSHLRDIDAFFRLLKLFA